MLSNLSKVEYFIQAMGSYEDKIFSKRGCMHHTSRKIKREKGQAKEEIVQTLSQPNFLCLLLVFMVPSSFWFSSLEVTSSRHEYQRKQYLNWRARKLESDAANHGLHESSMVPRCINWAGMCFHILLWNYDSVICGTDRSGG